MTYPILLEAICVIRKRMTERWPKNNDADAGTKEGIIKDRVRYSIRFVKKFISQRKMKFVSPTKNVPKPLAILQKTRSLSKYVQLELYCKNYRRRYPVQGHGTSCPSCKSSMQKKYQYRGLGHVDLEHAYLAVYNNASMFYSTGKGFAALVDDPDFASIKFKLVESPQSKV